MVTTTGAALAAPVPVLEVSDGGASCAGPLRDGERFHYAYTQSIYGSTVTEELARSGDRIVLLRVRSSDIRAVEYFRWDGAIAQDASGYVQDAPPYEVGRLVIRISPPYAQRIEGPGWSCDLPARFGGAIVTVTPAQRPLLLAASR